MDDWAQGIATVIEDDDEVAECSRSRRIFNASLCPPPDVYFRYVMTTGNNSVTDALQIDFDVSGTDVHHFKSKFLLARELKECYVVFAGDCGLEAKRLPGFNQAPCAKNRFPPSADCRKAIRALDCIWINYRDALIAKIMRERALSRPIGASDKNESWQFGWARRAVS